MVCIDGKQAIAAITRTTQKKESPFGQLLFLWAFAENPAGLLQGLYYQACSSRVTMSSCEGMRGLLLVQMSSSALAAMESRL